MERKPGKARSLTVAALEGGGRQRVDRFLIAILPVCFLITVLYLRDRIPGSLSEKVGKEVEC